MKIFVLCAATTLLTAQGLHTSALVKPDANMWQTHYGDYGGQRYSRLSQINRSNVGSMTLAWTFNTEPVMPPTFEAAMGRRATTLTSVPLEVNGMLYLTLPDHAWAVDAHTGRLLWHFYRPAPGTHAINRGLAMYENQIYFGTADAHVISLDARSGKKLWDKTLGDVRFGQAITMAPIVVHSQVGNHLVVGSSGDGADVPGFAVALDPETGGKEWQWRWDAVPKTGQPASETWPSGKTGADIMAHGGGNPSMTPTYDPDLNLLYFGTGGPRPAFAGDSRPGSNLYTCSIVALSADTGKMAWYFQASPHETHNWDAMETPVLFDAEFKGKARKLLAQASRNGYFFVLDRATGENLLSVPFVPINWSTGIDAKGQPIPKKNAEPRADGVLVSPGEYGATNWPPPSYNPDTKLLYVNARSGGFAMFYLTSKSTVPQGLAGIGRDVGRGTSALMAIDYATGKARWTTEAGGLGGVLSTAGGLVFTSGPANNVLALDAETGKILWHSGVGPMANSAMTYQLDGRQYIITPVQDVVYAWALPTR
jgi:acido-empty-quinoprotein group A